MSRKRTNTYKEPEKSKHIKFMLYPDCESHSKAIDLIKADNFPYLGIMHHIVDLDGNAITEGEGKPHYHIVQEYPNAVYPSAVAKRYGLFDDSGKVSVQFCRCVAGQWYGALQYLTHLNAPEKEYYPKSDLFGWDCLKREYDLAELAYYDKHIDLRTALFAMKQWVSYDHAGDVITSSMVIDWLLKSPYLRYRNERLFVRLIEEHNQRIYALEARNRLEGYSSSQIELNRRVSGIDFAELSDDEYKELKLGLYDDD